jgi:heat-inducible transcriptional repressor
MLDERKASILKAVVNQFIATGQPVGSNHIASDPEIGVSPATVRAEMAVLEQEGYLTHPHTSAGRIPTDLGFRYFVDNLQQSWTVSEVEIDEAFKFLKSAHSALEKILKETSRLLAELTGLTAVVVGQIPDMATVKSVQLVELNKLLVLLILVLSSGDVENMEVSLTKEITDETLIAKAEQHIKLAILNKQIKDIKPINVNTGDREIDWLVKEVSEVFHNYLARRKEATGRVFIDGTFHVAQSFSPAETVEELLRLLEHHYLIVSFLQALVEKGKEVSIGKENGESPWSECAVILTSCALAGQSVGMLGILGPRRINYQEVIPTVKIVGKKLEEKVEEISGIKGS